jgi:hypothetical protein
MLNWTHFSRYSIRDISEPYGFGDNPDEATKELEEQDPDHARDEKQEQDRINNKYNE